MPQRSYSFYDTVTFSNSAKVEHQAFQNRQGTDAANDKYKTNARGNGEFPTNESFVLQKLLFYPDSVLTQADAEVYLNNSYIQIEVADTQVFQASLREVVALAAYSGQFSQAIAADDAMIGIQNNGYELEIPITIEGGNSFRILIGQGTALSTGASTFKIVMMGTYNQP